jgi:hypothetical protein
VNADAIVADEIAHNRVRGTATNEEDRQDDNVGQGEDGEENGDRRTELRRRKAENVSPGTDHADTDDDKHIDEAGNDVIQPFVVVPEPVGCALILSEVASGDRTRQEGD